MSNPGSRTRCPRGRVPDSPRGRGDLLHEFALIQDLLEKTISEMKSRSASTVKSVELDVGESSGYSKESLKVAFDLLSAETEVKGAALVLTDVEGYEVVLKRIIME